ncbi:uncharacterized protein LOC142984589 isoform X2 [Anticarsia gemmatalis]|uniref:uncharacterized protein LOC142984589 isoform X2 n=1 Tax=Anticarsia gemmatalis TaxID=129554 RepID=UPI003F7740C1
MASKCSLIFLLVFCTSVQSATILEKGYDYLMNLGKNFAPNFLSILDCVGDEEPWGCAREKAGKMLDGWGEDVEKERRLWEEQADAEVRTSGRSLQAMPSALGREITDSFNSITDALERGVARALERKKHEGGIDTITISTGSGDKKKMKKKKPPKIHLVHPMMVPMRKANKEEKGRNFGTIQSWVIGERSLPENSTEEEVRNEGRGIMAELWDVGHETLDVLADDVIEREELENGIRDRSSVEAAKNSTRKLFVVSSTSLSTKIKGNHTEAGIELVIKPKQRGKKKKKKKFILKMLVLGSVLKAKISLLLQFLSYKLQLKFFIIALLSLAVNVARFWLDLKNKNSSQPQKIVEYVMPTFPPTTNKCNLESNANPCDDRNERKIIYYEHAQHQHHYDHEEEESHGWGPWSRSIFPDETEAETSEVSPYRAQERSPIVYSRPYLTRE